MAEPRSRSPANFHAFNALASAKASSNPSPNVLRAINPRHNPTQDTLNRLLKPFKLRLSLAPLAGKPRRTAA